MRSACCSPTWRWLALLVVSTGLFTASSAQSPSEREGVAAGARNVARRPPRQPSCNYISKLGLDFGNDPIDVPAAFDFHVGEIFADRVAKFHVYALADSPGFFFDVTYERQAVDIQVRAPQGGGGVPGRMYYVETSNSPTFYFQPSRGGAKDRIAFLDFAYRCTAPHRTYRDRYLITIRGTDRPPSAAERAQWTAQQDQEAVEVEAATPPPVLSRIRSAGRSGAPGGCSDLAVTMSARLPQVWQGDQAEFTVTVENLGPEVVSDSLITIPGIGPFLRYLKASQGRASQGYWREPVDFEPGPLEPGASATLTLRVLAAFAAPLTLSASGNAARDCNSQNNRAQSTVQVVTRPRPDLTGDWLRAEISGSPPLLHPHYTVRGKLRISNVGEVDAAPTRLVLFLSADKKAGPEDRLLGFADVPALSAGAAIELPVAYDFQSAPWVDEKHLIALVDSSNAEYENYERNNWVVSAPLR